MLNQIIGNDQVKEVFKRLLVNQKIPRSLLFVGEEGVGKRTLALEIAKSGVCQNPQAGEACAVCAACRRVPKFAFPKPDDRDAYKKVIFSEFPDVGLVIPYNKNIFVDAIRELETEANFRPYEAGKRFFLIDNADKMNDAAANALLKTLEEPPATSHIFLISSRPASLLPTIRSRCQIIRFAPVETSKIEDYLLKTQKYTAEDAELLAKLAAGSLGRALSMDIGKFRERRETGLKVLENLAGKNLAALLKTAEEINDAKNKDGYESFLETLQNLIHDVWILRLDDSENKITNIDLKSRLARLAENLDGRRLAGWLKEIEVLRENLAVNLNKKIATDALFMQMANN